MDLEQTSNGTHGEAKVSKRSRRKRNAKKNKKSATTEQDDQPRQKHNVFPQAIQTTQTLTLIPKDQLDLLISEKNELLKERNELNIRVQELSGQSMHYLSTLQATQAELEILREENLKLKAYIKTMESEMATLKKSVTSLEMDKEYSNFVIALQDMNREYRLESYTKLFSSMQKLRNQRVASCHYIVDGDSSDIINLKVKIALERLASMSQECKNKFSKRFGAQFLGDVYSAVSVPAPANVTDEDEEQVQEWWTG
jgi:chromosome segregation ATPase